MDDSTSENKVSKQKKISWGRVIYGFQESTDPFTRRQLFFIKTFSVVGFLAASTLGLINLSERNYYVGIPDLLTGIVFIFNLFLFSLIKKMQLTKGIMLSNFGILLLVLLATGGTAHTGIYWFFIFPIAAFFLMGKEKGIIWNLFLYCAVTIVFLLGSLDYVSLAYSLTEIRQLFISLAVVSVLVYLYQSAIEDSEKEIEQEKVKDEALLVSIGEGMIALDNNGKVLIINKTAKELLQVNDRDVLGKSYTEVMTIQDLKGKVVPHTERPLVKALEHADASKGEFIFVRRDGTSLPIMIVATPVILDGRIIGAIGLFRDITEERELERAKSEFVALASHQLRTPISAIGWFAEMLLNGDSGHLTNEQKEQVRQISLSNQRMTELVTALLHVSQIELGTLEVKPESVDISKVSHKLITEALSKEDKKLTLEEHYEDSIRNIIVDPELMRLIFQNLFSNAIKYTPINGKIFVNILASQNEGNIDGVMIQVKDTGIGIPKKQKEKIFTKLFRADNAREIETDGTGIGLYLIRALIDQIDGKIWFESEEGKGTTFFVWLPKEGMKYQTK